ncbi:MFS transporter [Methylobacterium sp. GC_Met_2]|uniref:MFS transporter n=1 Tax=Methylobacterium sp. GC_Met_2 TaxID=2937376 RepID=UPI00226B4EC0|nr:MFS transporter [Methylobacterium sp. GC_Met_2]
MIKARGDRLDAPGEAENGRDGSVAAIARRLDALPVTWLHVAIFAVSTLGLFADIAEVALSNALAAIFLAPPHNLPRSSLSLLLASVFAGGALGAPVFGLLGDRLGRKRALQASLVLMAIGSLAAALSTDLTSLTATRAVSGFAIGGFPPLVATLLAEVMPPRRRGAMLMICAGIGFLGGSAVIMLVQILAPVAPLGIEAWRWALILGAGLAALAAVLFAFLPESPRWLAAAGRPVEAQEACRRFMNSTRSQSTALTGEPPASPNARTPAGEAPAMRRITLFIALYALAPWATLGFPLLSAVVLLEKGFKVEQSLVFAALSLLGPPLGTLLTALVVDRLERRASLAVLGGTMAGLGTAFAASTGFVTLVLLGIAFNTAAAIYGAILSIYATELLPTRRRASILTCAWAGGRIASALAPFVLLPALTAYGPHGMFAIITAVLVASAALLLGGPRGLSGQPIVQTP